MFHKIIMKISTAEIIYIERIMVCFFLLCLFFWSGNASVLAQATPPNGATVDPYGGNSTYVVAPSAAFNPYDPPGVPESRPLFESLPSRPFSSNSAVNAQPRNRLFQNFGGDFTYITGGNNQNSLGLFRINFLGDIAFPICATQKAPLLIQPRFAANFWNGPRSDYYDMPASTLETAVGVGWRPRLQPDGWATALDFELAFSIGLYSDFKKLVSDSFRFPSYANVSMEITRNVHVKIGFWYLDRVRYKIWPVAGIIWTPTENWEFELMFPNPKVTYHPSSVSFKQMSLYARGEYGGGSWSITRYLSHDVNRVDYNDYRIMFGMDWKNSYQHEGFFEIGVAFARELYYSSTGSHSLDPAFVIAGGLRF